jgi:hypothetical protein
MGALWRTGGAERLGGVPGPRDHRIDERVDGLLVECIEDGGVRLASSRTDVVRDGRDFKCGSTTRPLSCACGGTKLPAVPEK